MKAIIAVVLGSCLSLGCSRTEIHLIPAGYRGEVAILPGYLTGVPPKREGLAIVFDIPKSGILITQDLPSAEWHLQQFYYVDASGSRQLIDMEPSTIHDTPENRANETPLVAMGTGVGETRGGDLPCVIYSFGYYVGSRAQFLARKSDEANAQRTRVDELVRSNHICR